MLYYFYVFIVIILYDKFVSHERRMMAARADQIAYIRLYKCNIFYHFCINIKIVKRIEIIWDALYKK